MGILRKNRRDTSVCRFCKVPITTENVYVERGHSGMGYLCKDCANRYTSIAITRRKSKGCYEERLNYYKDLVKRYEGFVSGKSVTEIMELEVRRIKRRNN